MRPTPEEIEPYREHTEHLDEVVYAEHDGVPLHLDVHRPRTAPPGPLPVIVWVHGGGWGWRGVKGGYREIMNIPFAARGYVAVGVEYRLSAEHRFPAQIQDIKTAIRWLRLHAAEYDLDPSRIGAWGRSAGGHLAALLGTSAGAAELDPGGALSGYSDCVQAVVSCFGPSDLTRILQPLEPEREAHIRKLTRLFLGGEIEDRPHLVDLANPVRFVTQDCPPHLFVHGRLDRSVPYSQSEILHRAILGAGGESRLIAVENADHGFLPLPEDARIRPGLEEIHEAIRSFFDTHLQNPREPKTQRS